MKRHSYGGKAAGCEKRVVRIGVHRYLFRIAREGDVIVSHLRSFGYRLFLIAMALFTLAARNGFAQGSGIGTIVDNFLVPIPQPSGICSDGNSFWIPNYSAVTGGQEIYKLNIWTHEITDSIRALDSTPSGLAWDGRGIWVMSTYPYNPFVSPDKTSLVRLSTSDSILNYMPARYTCYWAGIAWDGKDLYYGTNVCFASPKGQKSMIYKVNPATGAVIDSFPPPTGNINGLVYNKGDLWYCDDNNGYIFEIDTTGQIIREFPLQLQFHGPLSGLTIAKHYLWAVDMAGVNGPRIYEIDIGETPAVPEMFGCYTGPGYPGEIKMAWRPSTSPDIKLYKIYRQGPFQSGSGDLGEASVIASVPVNDTSYVDSIGTSGLAFTYWVSAVDSAGIESHVSQGFTGAAWLPQEFKLGQNYPNPFNPTTTIPYEVSTPWVPATHVTITVYDVLGRKVETLVDKDEGPGEKSVAFDASNLPSGVYFYRMRAGSHVETRKCMVIK